MSPFVDGLVSLEQQTIHIHDVTTTSQVTTIKNMLSQDIINYNYDNWYHGNNKPSSSIHDAMLLASLNENLIQQQQQQAPSDVKTTKTFQRDQVVRIIDGNTIKLEKAGLVTLAGIKMPS